jgi:hypothetical protein
VNRTRIAIAVPGILLGLFGVYRLLTEVPNDDLLVLAFWLVAALVLHDGVLSPVLVGIGWVLARVLPPRARSYVQAALVVAGLITVIALPMIYRQGTQPASKAILRQDYTTNLMIALGLIAVVTVLLYLARVVRDGQRTSATNVRPPEVQDSSTA